MRFKSVAVVCAVLLTIAGVSQAYASPSLTGKPVDPGKPSAAPANTPGNLKATEAAAQTPGAGASSGSGNAGNSGNSGNSGSAGNIGNSGPVAEKAKPVDVRNLIKAAQESADAVDTSASSTYIIRFNESAVLGNEVSALKASKVAVGRTYSHIFKGAVAKMTAKQAAAWAKRSTVASVEVDAMAEIQTSEVGATWGIDRIDQATLPLSFSYDYTNTGSGVTAFVIDTGIYAANADFGGRVAAGYTAVTDGNGTVDCNGHGTHVAGTIGSNTFGVAKAVTLVPVRVLDCSGSGSYSNVIAGLDWVAANYVAGTPAVANLSLGGPTSSTLDSAINNLINRGVTVVVAAGNSAADACTSSPARVPNAITVAASDNNDQFAYFSNFGSCVDLEAPGVNITSTWMGSTTAVNTISGTSMASPHVAGVVALMLSTGYRLPTQVAAELLAATSTGQLGAVPSGTVNKLLFSSPTGWGSISTPTATAPTAPSGVTATAGSRSATIKWSLPSSDGGSPLTGQTVKVWSGTTLVGTVSATATATSLTVKGLRQGSVYRFSVLAMNAIGSSADSALSAAITVKK
ncbi:MAG: S8 family serine peptidase [Rhodoluna sp.]